MRNALGSILVALLNKVILPEADRAVFIERMQDKLGLISFNKLPCLLLFLVTATAFGAEPHDRVFDGIYFPPAGRSMKNQDRRKPKEVGFDTAVVDRINAFVAENPYTRRKVTPRWALWRHGRLVHLQGDFKKTVDVASRRKKRHAQIVGAAIKQKLISSHHQPIRPWLPEIKGNDARAT